jgi:predicted metal-dependent hydrolase
MKEITEFAHYTVEIWRRPRQRGMRLTVRSDGSVRVTCSRRCPRREILEFVSESRGFIEKRALELEALRRRFPPKQMLSEESFLLLGERRALSVVWTWNSRIGVTLTEGGRLEMAAPLGSSTAERVEALRSFYRRLARGHLTLRLRALGAAMDLAPRSFAVRGQTTRWGSCSARGQISLNWKLMAAPLEVIDYVIVHELAHLVHMNHSRRFWDLVGRFHPEWRSAKSWLSQHEPEINSQFP